MNVEIISYAVNGEEGEDGDESADSALLSDDENKIRYFKMGETVDPVTVYLLLFIQMELCEI